MLACPNSAHLEEDALIFNFDGGNIRIKDYSKLRSPCIQTIGP